MFDVVYDFNSWQLHLQRALASASSATRGFGSLCEVFLKKDYRFAVFGGFVRDLHLQGPGVVPRDIDIVVEGPTTSELSALLADMDAPTSLNLYGGLRTTLAGTRFDIWPVEVTWAFREGLVSQSLENLPRTTFHNLDALAAVSSGSGFNLVEHGYLEAVHNRILRINLREHPRPITVVAKTFSLVQRYGFALDADLIAYMADRLLVDDASSVLSEVTRHYGYQTVHPGTLARWIDEVREAGNHHAPQLALSQLG